MSIGKNAAPSSIRILKGPSECARERQVYFSIEAEEILLPETIKYLGDSHFVYATDSPHWDCEFPENLEGLAQRSDLSTEMKERILYRNARVLYNY
jgi:predicted TIM-barrel fold metal-dependent hydrolase